MKALTKSQKEILSCMKEGFELVKINSGANLNKGKLSRYAKRDDVDTLHRNGLIKLVSREFKDNFYLILIFELA